VRRGRGGVRGAPAPRLPYHEEVLSLLADLQTPADEAARRARLAAAPRRFLPRRNETSSDGSSDDLL
jgi:hypothetical protein